MSCLQEPILTPVVKALEYYSDMNEKMEQDKEAVKLKQVGRRISSTIDPKVGLSVTRALGYSGFPGCL